METDDSLGAYSGFDFDLKDRVLHSWSSRNMTRIYFHSRFRESLLNDWGTHTFIHGSLASSSTLSYPQSIQSNTNSYTNLSKEKKNLFVVNVVSGWDDIIWWQLRTMNECVRAAVTQEAFSESSVEKNEFLILGKQWMTYSNFARQCWVFSSSAASKGVKGISQKGIRHKKQLNICLSV